MNALMYSVTCRHMVTVKAAGLRSSLWRTVILKVSLGCDSNVTASVHCHFESSDSEYCQFFFHKIHQCYFDVLTSRKFI